MRIESCPECESQALFFGKVEEAAGYAERGVLSCGDCQYWRLIDLRRQEPPVKEKKSE